MIVMIFLFSAYCVGKEGYTLMITLILVPKNVYYFALISAYFSYSSNDI